MSCSVSSTSSAGAASQVYAQSSKQASAPPPQAQQKSDSVTLSQQATTAIATERASTPGAGGKSAKGVSCDRRSTSLWAAVVLSPYSL
jgi:hypothetical protein